MRSFDIFSAFSLTNVSERSSTMLLMRWCNMLTGKMYHKCFLSLSHVITYIYRMMTSWHRTAFHVTGLYEGDPPVTGGFPSQMASSIAGFDVFFDVSLNNPLNKKPICRLFETPWRSLWGHCNDEVIIRLLHICLRVSFLLPVLCVLYESVILKPLNWGWMHNYNV